jgi:drug/metabolite transporter (DMT)-like permease
VPFYIFFVRDIISKIYNWGEILKNEKISYLYAMLAVFFWSTVASAFKIALAYVDVLKLLFYASLTSTMILFFVNILFKTFSVPDRKQVINSIFLGAVNPFIYYLVLFKAYDLLPAQIAQPLNYTWPIVLSVFSVIFLHQHFHLKLLISILLSFTGVLILSLGANFSAINFSLTGIFLALASAFIWASYWILNVRRKFPPLMGLLLNFIFGTIYSGIFLLILKENFLLPNIDSVLSLMYVGTFEMGLTFALWFNALKTTSNTAKISNLIYIAPFLSLIFIHYIIGEEIRITTLYGLALIVVSILIQSLNLKRS